MGQVQSEQPNAVAPTISRIAAGALKWSPTAWLKSWLLYVGIQSHVHSTVDPELKPLHNVCEYLNALHIYTEEARQGLVRTVDAHHFCSYVGKDLRQCLIYDSCKPDARLIGVEFMIPRDRYERLDAEEQKLWHSHEFEVKSGMLVLPYPTTHRGREAQWDKLETRAMEEVVGLYGKLYHFWEVDKGHDLPLGPPKLMGSLTSSRQLNVDEAMAERNKELGIKQPEKRAMRAEIALPGIHENADSWWKQAEREHKGIYASADDVVCKQTDHQVLLTQTLVSGTVYVGAYPNHEERILWLQYGRDARLYPTVYTLWQNPGLVPLLHTQDFVVEKLQTGADLMTPGLMGGSVPVWVGVCKIDVSGLGRVQAMKAPAVEGVHWVGDEVWSWSQNGSGGRSAPERIEGWERTVGDVEQGVGQMDLQDGEEEAEEEEGEQEDGGVAVGDEATNLQNGHAEQPEDAAEDGADEDAQHEPTTKEADDAFDQAFLYAI